MTVFKFYLDYIQKCFNFNVPTTDTFKVYLVKSGYSSEYVGFEDGAVSVFEDGVGVIYE